MEHKDDEKLCKDLPVLLASFVDTFVDFSVSGGLFLPPPPPPPSPSPNQTTAVDNLDSHNTATTSNLPPAAAPLQTRLLSPDRLIAIGDLHGDLQKSKQALRLAGVIDASDKWTGGTATVVQIGDVLDRGGEELKILYLLEKLKREAAKAGGNVITMNGNHEIMNVQGDFRYVTQLGLREFESWAYWYSLGDRMKGLCAGLQKPKDIYKGIPLTFLGVKPEAFPGIRARIAALRPNGPIANKFLSQNATVLVAGDSVFVHGGLLSKHVEYGLERINEEVRDWISGLTGNFAPEYCRGRNGVVWLRKFSNKLAKNCDCSALDHVLATIPGVRRMIMGHTIQEAGINGVCDHRAIRIDVGMSKGCINGLPEVLEITQNSELRVLTSNPRYQEDYKSNLVVDKKDRLGLVIPENGPKQVEVKA
uniref:Calcineurin-like phosphoesterase domain-containing protein n=1 Tax=Rhizophora mucronata TaxID=61149 RepID=A0A2P2QQQ8_RHIMU